MKFIKLAEGLFNQQHYLYCFTIILYFEPVDLLKYPAMCLMTKSAGSSRTCKSVPLLLKQYISAVSKFRGLMKDLDVGVH